MKGFIMGLVAVSVPTVAVSNKISGTRNGAVSTNDAPGTKKLNEDCSTNWECGDRSWCGGPPKGGSRGDKCRDHECKEVDAMQKTCPDPLVPNGVCNEDMWTGGEWTYAAPHICNKDCRVLLNRELKDTYKWTESNRAVFWSYNTCNEYCWDQKIDGKDTGCEISHFSRPRYP